MPKKLNWMRKICKRGGLWALCRKLTIPMTTLPVRVFSPALSENCYLNAGISTPDKKLKRQYLSI